MSHGLDSLPVPLATSGEWSGLKKPCHLDFQQFLDSLCISPLSPPAVLEVAQKAYAHAYPPNWSEELDAASGALYFYHRLKDEASWQHPLAEAYQEVFGLVGDAVGERLRLDQLAVRIEESLTEAQGRAARDLEQWIGPIDGCFEEDEGMTYFYNTLTGSSSWEDPREMWKYELHVRYDLLVGYLVTQERSSAGRRGEQGAAPVPDLTHTLTSLASSMSSVQSVLANSLTPPSRAPAPQYVGDPDDPEANGARWARPRARKGGLPLPPKRTGATADRALFSMPPHQQRYASDVLQQQQEPRSPAPGVSAAKQNSPPPPPPPGTPARGTGW